MLGAGAGALVRGGTYPQRQWPRKNTCEYRARGEQRRLEQVWTRGANSRWCRASEVEVDSAAQHGTATQRQRQQNRGAKHQQKRKRKEAKKQNAKAQ